MGWSRTETDVQWNTGNDTYSITTGADFTSDAITLTAGPWQRQIMVKADNAGTPASGDTVDFYLIEVGDADHDTTDDSTNQGIYLGTVDTYSTNGLGDNNDPAVKTFYFGSEFGTVKLAALNNGASSVTVSALITETIYTA